MRSVIFKIYWMLERWITPGLRCTQTAYAQTVQSHVTPQTRWLDIGCGHQLWAEYVGGQQEAAAKAALVVGLDPDVHSLSQNRVVDHRVAGLDLPFRDGTFNLVTANMVFEHLENPVEVLTAIRRVMSDDGVCIFHTPNSRCWSIVVGRHFPQSLKNILIRYSQQRDEKDVYSTHYRINTEGEIVAHARAAGFTADQVLMLNSSATSRIMLFGPFVVLDLLWTRVTNGPKFRHQRSNIIGVLRAADEHVVSQRSDTRAVSV